MPFTLSHPAAALPFARRPLIPAAVVAGSMAPDLTLFSSFGPSYLGTHSLTGIVTWDVLFALLMLGCWYGVLREPLLALLPSWASGRVPPKRSWSPTDLAWVPVSVVTGAGTHVLWDSFTHGQAVAIWGWRWLGAPGPGGLPVYDVLQYISSIVGLAVLAWWGARRPVVQTSAPPVAAASRVAIAAGILAAGAATGLVYAWASAAAAWLTIAYQAVVGGVTGAVLMLGGYAAAWRVRMALRG